MQPLHIEAWSRMTTEQSMILDRVEVEAVEPLRVVIVDDLVVTATMFKDCVATIRGVEPLAFSDPVAALAWCEANEPDLILLDYAMPGLDGRSFLERVRALPHLAAVPTMIITGWVEREVLYALLDAGANDFLTKPVDETELIARTRNMLKLRRHMLELQEVNAKLQALASTDSLTGLPNRRRLLDQIAHDLDRARRYGQPVTLAVLDIDHFKCINDGFGHAAGDEVLRTLARVARWSLRGADVIGRLGGEEFAVVMPQTALPAAMVACERLRCDLAAQRMVIPGGVAGFTVSIGIAALDPQHDDVDRALARADAALYHAKHLGRNRVVTVEADVPSPEVAMLRTVSPGGTSRGPAATRRPNGGAALRGPA